MPPIPPPQRQRFSAGVPADWGYGHAIDWRFVGGGFDRIGPATVWTRVRLPLIDGQEPSSLQRMVIVADSANGLSAELDFGAWLFVPTSFSLTVHRHLVGEWMLLDATTRIETSGVGMANADLADPDGRLGVITQPLVVARR